MPKFNELIEMLKVHEGVETYAYKCSENKTTIGVGRNVDKNGGLGLSDDEVDYLLQNDINRIILELDSEYSWYSDLDDVRQNAMIDISFNLGQTRLRAFKKALAAMSEGDWDEAADQFMDSRWSEQVGIRAKNLTEMIRSGAY
jgi:lysozyme|tara:strand:+ start:2117 stop:2545 length:429 start_codon:yes stop_codon:yes gene_type:complete